MTTEEILIKFKHLPASEIVESAIKILRNNDTLVITAPPGAGKSTLLPIALMNGLNNSGKILMLEPRRLAARHIAERMANMLGEEVGESVGYRVRFDNKTSESTQLEVITEGILTRMLIEDPTLENVNMVIFDEFHERSINTDLSFALSLHARNILRSDLKIVVMSATIAANNICTFLHAPLLESRGNMYPVDVFYEKEDTDKNDIFRKTASVICQAHREHNGDILAFLPGKTDIIKCKELLGNALHPTKVYTLYGEMSIREQNMALTPSYCNERKVVLATPIAETSLTIEGVRIVVDSGLYRALKFDARTGLSHLETQRISIDMATQRKGRAGRITPGICYRLWSKGTELNMEKHHQPEITEADLAPLLLSVTSFGEKDIFSLPWLTPPPKEGVIKARNLLILLGALNTDGTITTLGNKMSIMPCHPRIARMILSFPNKRMRSLACDIAAILEEKDPLHDSAGSDLTLRISLLRKARKCNHHNQWERIIKISHEYRRLSHSPEDNTDAAPEEVGELIAYAYPERIAMATNFSGEYHLANDNKVLLNNKDIMSSYKWIAIASLYAPKGSHGKVFLAAPLNPNDLDDEIITTHDNISWDNRHGCIVKCREKRIGRILVESKPIHNVNPDEIISIISEATKRYGLSMFSWNEDVFSLQRRIDFVTLWHPELNIPNVSTESIINTAAEWLPYYIMKEGRVMSTTEELKKIDLKEVIWNRISYDQQKEIDKIAPTYIKMPTGSNIRISYRQGAEFPILSVRLQECFGMKQTPYINNGKTPILMELLSPGFKPVQLTLDLENFWNNTYFEVRKELRRNYPKHFWPDNPAESNPTKSVKRPKNKG